MHSFSPTSPTLSSPTCTSFSSLPTKGHYVNFMTGVCICIILCERAQMFGFRAIQSLRDAHGLSKFVLRAAVFTQLQVKCQAKYIII